MYPQFLDGLGLPAFRIGLNPLLSRVQATSTQLVPFRASRQPFLKSFTMGQDIQRSIPQLRCVNERLLALGSRVMASGTTQCFPRKASFGMVLKDRGYLVRRPGSES